MRISNADIVAAMAGMNIADADRPTLFDEVKEIVTVIAEAVRAERDKQQQKDQPHGHPQNRSGRRR